MFSGWEALLLIDPRMRLLSAYGLMIFMLVLTGCRTGVPQDSTYAAEIRRTWSRLAARGSDIRTEWKFVLGLLAMACAFAVMSMAARDIGDGSQTGPGWLVAAYFLLTISELCIWAISLAAVTRLAPQRHEALIVGLWYLAIAIGGGCAGQIGALVAETLIDEVFALLSKMFILGAIALVAAAPVTGRLTRRAVTA